MPYIQEQDRDYFHSLENEARDRPARTKGELNYLLTLIALNFFNNQEKQNYDTRADVISAFECAKLEFYRRQISNYEDKKIAENGDVY